MGIGPPEVPITALLLTITAGWEAPSPLAGLSGHSRGRFLENHHRVEAEVTPVCCASQELNAISCVYIVLSLPNLVPIENTGLSLGQRQKA